MIYVKHVLLTANKMIKEGDTISDIPEFESPSFHVTEKRIRESKKQGIVRFRRRHKQNGQHNEMTLK